MSAQSLQRCCQIANPLTPFYRLHTLTGYIQIDTLYSHSTRVLHSYRGQRHRHRYRHRHRQQNKDSYTADVALQSGVDQVIRVVRSDRNDGNSRVQCVSGVSSVWKYSE